MPTIYGYKLRWVEDEVDCTKCGAPHDGKWFMVKVAETGDLLCRDCLPVFKAKAKAHYESRDVSRDHLGGGYCGYD
jgi:ribosome-binding protein aMBF1 (putative translation factor)